LSVVRGQLSVDREAVQAKAHHAMGKRSTFNAQRSTFKKGLDVFTWMLNVES
jgi:hypothetical protein